MSKSVLSLEGLRTRSRNPQKVISLEGLRTRPKTQEKGFLDRTKQFGSGLLSGFLEPAFREAQQQAQAGVMEIAPGVVAPISESSAMANIPQKGVESLESMRPTESDSLGRILHHAGEFGGGMASFPMLTGQAVTNSAKSLMSRFGKNVGMGTAMGGASGILQEGGINPLVADLVPAVAGPLVGGVGKNLLSRFSPQKRLNAKVGDTLKKEIGEKNIPAVLQRLDNTLPLGANPTTAELAQNVGVSKLHQAMAPNISGIAEKQALNDAIIRKQLNTISPTIGANPEYIGETVRNNLFNKLEAAKKARAGITEPLYQKVNELTKGVELPNTRTFLENESKYAKGDIQNNLRYIEDLIRSNQSSKGELNSFNKLYGNLGPEAQLQLKKEVLGNPLPAELTSAVKDISGRIGSAKKAGNNEVARILSQAKENILADMSYIPEEKIARSTYAQLSKPVSAIEKEPLLNKFIKKDEFGKDFAVSPEKIPDMILSGTLNNTKALVSQVGTNKKTMDAIRGSIVDKLLNTTELASSNAQGQQNLSYNKVNSFLKKNREKLKLIFDKDQMKVLEDVKEILKRRNMVATMGRAAGSNTQSETTLLNSLFKTAGSKVLREGASYFVPGGGFAYDAAANALKGSKTKAMKELLEKALLEPETAKLLLTPTNQIKDAKTLESILEKIYNRTPSLLTGANLGNREK